ncbi:MULTISPECIES: hypothetical protein [Thermoleptolyngbya]|nr:MULTISPECIES: hypothetical protein [Thermoleptolyngbya]
MRLSYGVEKDVARAIAPTEKLGKPKLARTSQRASGKSSYGY